MTVAGAGAPVSKKSSWVVPHSANELRSRLSWHATEQGRQKAGSWATPALTPSHSLTGWRRGPHRGLPAGRATPRRSTCTPSRNRRSPGLRKITQISISLVETENGWTAVFDGLQCFFSAMSLLEWLRNAVDAPSSSSERSCEGGGGLPSPYAATDGSAAPAGAPRRAAAPRSSTATAAPTPCNQPRGVRRHGTWRRHRRTRPLRQEHRQAGRCRCLATTAAAVRGGVCRCRGQLRLSSEDAVHPAGCLAEVLLDELACALPQNVFFAMQTRCANAFVGIRGCRMLSGLPERQQRRSLPSRRHAVSNAKGETDRPAHVMPTNAGSLCHGEGRHAGPS